METTAPTNSFWKTVASSADGTTLIAASIGISTCGIYISTNSGNAWIMADFPNNSWSSVASSADGSRLVAVAGSDIHFNPTSSVYTSTDYGTTWTLQTNAPNKRWTTVTSSSDGSKLILFTADTIYFSTNSGVNWLQVNNPPEHWSASSSKELACSADGTGLAVILNGNFNTCSIDISSNWGLTWTKTSAPTNGYLSSIACSADGSKLVTSANPGLLFLSSDFGLTWKSNNVSASWFAVAASADGNKMLAIARPGGIWTAQTTPSPQLTITSSSTNLALSWMIPSTSFVLQRSSDLISWADVVNPPALDLKDLQNQVMLSPSNRIGFYRLATP